MATDSVLGLFQDPQALAMQNYAAQNKAAMEASLQHAQLDPFQRAAQMAYMGGHQAGNAIGSVLGVQDPQLQLAALRQTTLKDYDPNTLEGLQGAAKALRDAGDLQGAYALAQRAQTHQAQIDEKQVARDQALLIAREKNQTTAQLAQERNAIMLTIAQMNNALKNANSDVQRQLIEQRIADLKTKADEKQATLETQQQGRVTAFDSALDTLNVISTHPGKKDVVGAITGGVRSMIPGTDAAGFASQLETFKAQTFIPMVANLKGMGALSDAEGKKLTAAVGALDPKMKQSEFDSQVAKIKGDLEAAKQRALRISSGGSNQPSQPALGTIANPIVLK